MQKNINIIFERIAMYLREEIDPKTPQEISNWTGINLGDVYDTLRSNPAFFREIIIDSSLKGWIINYYF